MKKTEEKDSYALAKLIIDAFGPILTFAGILIGVSNFNTEQKENKEKEQKAQTYLDVMEFKRKNWEKQQEVYVQIAETIGKIMNVVTDKPGDSSQKATLSFEELYYGKAAFVEDSAVASNMRRFHDALTDYKDGFRTGNYLKSVGFEVISSCKTSSLNTWKALSKLP